jgi:hypothetical protein
VRKFIWIAFIFPVIASAQKNHFFSLAGGVNFKKYYEPMTGAQLRPTLKSGRASMLAEK